MKDFCVLFDMDGVIFDTESQYSVIWKHLGDKYTSGIENFELKIKGVTLPNILMKYFSHLSETEKQSLVKALDDFEKDMKFPEISGAMRFIKELKSEGYKIGLVTSSNDLKLDIVYQYVDLRLIFDTIVSANRIIKGKPDPMCYLLAAQDLGYEPKNSFVFEDAFSGIAAGNAAGMKVIGLSTTNPADQLEDQCVSVIPDFQNFTLANLKALR